MPLSLLSFRVRRETDASLPIAQQSSRKSGVDYVIAVSQEHGMKFN